MLYSGGGPSVSFGLRDTDARLFGDLPFHVANGRERPEYRVFNAALRARHELPRSVYFLETALLGELRWRMLASDPAARIPRAAGAHDAPDAASQGRAPRYGELPSPFEPALAMLAAGYAFWAVSPSAVVLVHPEFA